MFFRKPSDHVPHVTIFHTILRSMLWILFIEIALLVGILYLCRINTNLEQNAVDILQIQTENRQNYLQGQMLDAQDLSSLAGKINAVTQVMLDDGEISLDTLDSGSDAASPLLLSIGDNLISSMLSRICPSGSAIRIVAGSFSSNVYMSPHKCIPFVTKL